MKLVYQKGIYGNPDSYEKPQYRLTKCEETQALQM